MEKLFEKFLILLWAVLVATSAQASAWEVVRSVWTEEDEKAYSNFVERICDSKYGNLNKFIRDPKVNPFYGEEDKKINLSPDCADLPYLIRAYVAYKLRLPFSYVSEISGNGGDQRYSKGNKPKNFKDQDYFTSPQQLFSKVTLINSGYFRMAATTENSDHYPIKINKKNLTPGTIYYDPDGHIALVAKVYDNGRIRLIDAHPDRSISKPWFGSKFSRGSRTNGGGFKKWRQIRYTSTGKTIRTQNHNLLAYSATDQYSKSFSINGKSNLTYHEYVRLSLASTGARSDPITEFVFMMQDIYEDIKYRAVAVNMAIEKGCHLKPHPGKLPYNIYGTDGIWEELSTPSRDARLKVAFREFYDYTRQVIMSAEKSNPQLARALAYNFLLKYDELNPKFNISYTNSAGKKVILNFADVNSRLFDLSFDPYHSIEYRWGAKGAELATANDGETKKKFYILEKRLRNQLERVYGCNTPLTMGPEQPVSVDIRGWLYAYIQGSTVDKSIVAFNRKIIAEQPQNIVLGKTANEPSQKAVVAMATTEKAKVNKELFNLAIQREPVVIPVSMLAKASTGLTEKQNLLPSSLAANQKVIGLAESKVELAYKPPISSQIEEATPVLKESSMNATIVVEEKEPSFWDNLLISGDRFAAVISDRNNYCNPSQ